MAKTTENVDLKPINNNQDCDAVESEVVLYPKLDATAVSSSKSIGPQSNTQQQAQSVLQQTTVTYHRNGHSRNPSSINGITIATQVIQPPPNKPDAINSLLKLIRFRSEDYEECDEKSENRQYCGIREARLISK